MPAITRFFRFILFTVFFITGASAVSISILVGEIDGYYESRQQLAEIEAQNAELTALLKDYDMRIYQARTNPDTIEKLQRVTLGIEPKAEDTIFPQASPSQLKSVEQVLETAETPTDEAPVRPQWVVRCSEPRFRYALFFAGFGLILVNFIFFGRPGPYADGEIRTVASQTA
ncbi:hypothetical protein STSP2_00003 [Anaerohalosphaera lusitana]|uniref:Septum formation initiator n=1 Tax=Anaerohalosphaera lusitana TaxID=1936003 RepID=A0A1U9NGC4_9BACT|nr:hypothetical protein [Anaerohalosphaera lusitana]AQT66865.1 hypothetical protein STSP2_00003 [Anaerohalosphaera lusitana]